MVAVDRNLFSPLGFFFLIIFGIESIVSLLGNGFILAVSGHSCIWSKKMLPCDFLLTALSLSRFLLQWVSMSNQFMYFSSPETFLDNQGKQIFMLSWAYLNIASLCCATGLNVFYCVKVANFAHPFFAWLKLRIAVLVPKFLGISLLAFIICSIHPAKRSFEDEKGHNLTGNLPEKMSQMDVHDNRSVTDVHPKFFTFTFLHALQIYFTAISFCICLTASVVLLLSLWRHTRNLKKGGLGTKDFSTQAHLRVMNLLLLSLFFYILHFAILILVFTTVVKFGKLEHLISDIFLYLYPSLHSIILIFASPNLSKIFTRVLNLRRTAL